MVLLVKKKDGTWRFYANYEALNSIIIKDLFLIPIMDELLNKLHGSTVFSKLDLHSGYHQILLALADTFKITFHTIDGYFEFLVMSSELTNTLSMFKETMNKIFLYSRC